MSRFLYLPLVLLVSFWACQEATNSEATAETTTAEVSNPPAEGFKAEASDPQAIEIADAVMEAMGGRAAWDATRYLSWNFFGARTLVWDKHSGDVRIDIPGNDLHILLNVYDETAGKAMQSGELIEHPDSLQQVLEQGKSIWINDSYWLVMPYKLKDSGVTLTYVKEDTTQQGFNADVLQLTFENVGRTPQNKYHVYVDKTDNLVKQWDFYRNATDSMPGFSTIWGDYQQYGDILLSGDRGERDLTDIAVYDTLSPTVFTELMPVAPH